MTELVLYLVKAGVCLALLYFVYKYTLSGETLFRLNRTIILSIVLLSIILPVWTITIFKEIAAPAGLNQEVAIAGSSTPSLFNQEVNDSGWFSVIQIIAICIYIIGALSLLGKNIYGIFQIYRIMRNSSQVINSDEKLYICNKQIIPFSWFNNIIISEEDYNSNKEIIIDHEKAHIKLKHNYDLLFINTVAIFQWFNPIFWLLRKELITIHEYQADSCVLKNGIDARKYQYLLISKGTQQSFSIPVVNHLCSGNFQKRIKMMLKKRSSPNRAIKALFILPMVAAAVTVFAETEYVVSPRDVSVPIFSEIQPSDIKVIPETLENQIVKFVATKIIYPEEAKSAGLQGTYNVKISTEKGVVKSAEIIEKNDELKVTLLDKVIVVAYAKSEINKSEANQNDGTIAIKKELLRLSDLLSQIESPDWKNSNLDFALEIEFQLR